MKKALPLTLVLIGAALLITAVVFWIDSSTSTEPQSFGKTLLDWVTLIAGLGASIKGWIDLFKPDKPTPPTTKIDIKGGNPQISTGDHARNIQAETYIENQTVQQAQEPKTPKSLNQLPAPPLDFIGREKELDQLRQNIEKGVVISGVQGMGGIGKTALGLKLAEQIAQSYPDGQIYLDLRGAHEQASLTPEQVMAHVIRSFHPEAALPMDFGELGAMYRSVLAGKKALLFYDNARDENQLNDVIPPKGCVLFVTSRQYFTLPGLVAIDLETLAPKDAIELVQEISSRVNEKDAETLAKLCGCLPLAIRAAVSVLLRRPDWSAAELIKRLGDNRTRLGLVDGSLSLSYDALDAELQKYLYQLGIFAAPFDKEVILAIWFDEGESLSSELDFALLLLSKRDKNSYVDKSFEQKANEILGNLLKTSLLKYDTNSGDYYFHDLTFLFLEEKLRQSDQWLEIVKRYAQYYLRLAVQLNVEYQSKGDLALLSLTRFRKIWAHLNRASEILSLIQQSSIINANLWLTLSSGEIHEILDTSLTPQMYIPFVQRSLVASKELGNKEGIVGNLNLLGDAYSVIGDADKSMDLYLEALPIAREIGNMGSTLSNIGSAFAAIGNFHEAIRYYEEALAIARKDGVRRSESVRLSRIADAYNALGKPYSAVEYYEKAITIAREVEDKRILGGCLGGLGMSYYSLGDIDKAIEYYEQALVISRELGEKRSESVWLGNLGFIKDSKTFIDSGAIISQTIGSKKVEALLLCATAIKKRRDGNFQDSLVLFEEALKLSDELGDDYSRCQILDNMANTFADLGDHVKAIEYYQKAMQLVKTFDDEQMTANIAWNLATVYYEQEHYELAVKYMKIMVDFEQKINHPNASADLEALNQVLAKMQNTTKSEEKN